MRSRVNDMMPVKLYLQVMKCFTDYYKEYRLSSNLCVDLTQSLGPICEKLEKGEYNMGK